MKMSNLLLLLLVTAILSTACNRKVVIVKTSPSKASGHVPPGQAKKMTGTQSAKTYAPGQQKKG